MEPRPQFPYKKLIDTKTGAKEVLVTSLGYFVEQEKMVLMELLRTRGFGDPEVSNQLMGWIEMEEKVAELDRTKRKYILLELARSDLYLAMDDTDEALACLDEASFKAQQEGHFDLQDMVEARITAVIKVHKAIIESNKNGGNGEEGF